MAEQPEKCVRLRIEGRVQGVGFRAFVANEAHALGLDGWVRNRRDGGVEMVISGPTNRVDRMIERCRAGLSGSRIDVLKVLEEPDPTTPGFEVRPTV